jgi:hypothetical protein
MMVNERDEVTATAGDSVVAVLESYRVFLVDERGLAAESVRCYLLDARVFLTQLPDPLGVSLAGLSAGQVTGFVLGYCRVATPGRPRRWSPGCGRCCGSCMWPGWYPCRRSGPCPRSRAGGERRYPAPWPQAR